MTDKKNILLVGAGGVGTMAAVSLEASGRASVTAVLRSNFASVEEHGFHIESIAYGNLKGWKPTKVTNKVPNVVQGNHPPFD
ncbi:putative 2-dehydropantoate 2-reductase protein [Eutypa lata UCREL1]|uniref:Putative 2-dehydropantoate 2-reductase protein n=1 Tax=Eutypa lata (strain UCR-EL1) TaxID=1287681 RepID=M7TQS2_EUTLA|nr:putative 2-dehydropantoate 2-reductase protein [Eutypa lata UCREL1]